MGTKAVMNCFMKEKKVCVYFPHCKTMGTISVENYFMKEKVCEYFIQCKAMGIIAVKKTISV